MEFATNHTFCSKMNIFQLFPCNWYSNLLIKIIEYLQLIKLVANEVMKKQDEISKMIFFECINNKFI